MVLKRNNAVIVVPPSCVVDFSPFMGIEKGAVLQEARVFNDPQLDARRCSQVNKLQTF